VNTNASVAGSRSVTSTESWQAKDRHGLGSGGLDQGLRVLALLMSGLIFYGGLGWLGDTLFHTEFLLPIGLMVGMALGVCAVIFRFGRGEHDRGKDGR